MSETNAERLANIKRIRAEHLIREDGTAAIAVTELKFLVEQAERVPELENDIEVTSMAAGDSANDLVMSQDKYKRLVESYKELTIQENAMQGHYQLAFSSMQMYKKCCDDITLAMNTERPAEEKTKDVRRILEGLK